MKTVTRAQIESVLYGILQRFTTLDNAEEVEITEEEVETMLYILDLSDRRYMQLDPTTLAALRNMRTIHLRRSAAAKWNP